MRKYSLTFLFFTLVSFQVAAQNLGSGIVPSVSLKNCQADQWTGENGLVSNNLTSVTQSNDGFLWITTNNGIMRFDGNKLEVFDKTSEPIFVTDGFVKAYDYNNVLYFTTRGNGIVRFESGAFNQFLPNDTILPKSTRSLLFSKTGKIYVGTDTKGVYIIDNEKVTPLPGFPIFNSMIISLAEASDGSIWIATEGKGLFHYQLNGTYKEYNEGNGLLDNSLLFVNVLNDGRVLAGTASGINCYENGELKSWNFLKGTRVNCILTDRFESIWFGTELGLGRINETTQTEEFLHNDDKFRLSHITSMVFDEEGSLWMSTVKSGLIRIKDTNILNYSTNQGLSLNRVNVVVEDSAGNFFIGQDEGFIDIIAGDKVSPLKLDVVSKTSIRDIAIDKNGTMWIATYAGLVKKTKFKEVLFEDPLFPAQDFRRIFFDSNNYMWLATKTGGVIQLKEEKVIGTWNIENGLGSNYILDLEEGLNNEIYIGTHSGGLSVLNSQSGKLVTHHILSDDAGILIFNVHVDTLGKVWLVANSGLYHFNGNKIIPIYLDEFTKGESFFDWVEDDYGNVWVSSNIGVVQFKKQDVLDHVNGKIQKVKRRLFDQDYGMLGKECTGATHSLKASDGRIWIPTLDGVCVIDPHKSSENLQVPPVYITQFYTDKGNILTWNKNQGFEIKPGNLRYTFNFTALSLMAPKKVKFRYKLQNFDEDWIDAQERSAHYTKLPPGHYTFTVIACNNDGIWNLVGDSIKIEVQPKFYQTGQFYFLMTLLAIVTLFGAYQWRIYGIKKKNLELTKVNSELDRFVYSASHDLRAPLASILGLINVSRLDKSPSNQEEYFNLIEKSVKKLDSFINDIIEFSRNSRLKVSSVPIDFEALVHSLIDELKFLDEKNQIRRVVNVKGHGQFTTDQKRLTIVLNNLISNSIKYHNLYGDDPYLEVDIDYTVQIAHIKVKDNGMGISSEHLEHIFKMFYRANESSKGSGLGLYIVKEALEKINGKITVESEPYKGSTFHITIRPIVEEKESEIQTVINKVKAWFSFAEKKEAF